MLDPRPSTPLQLVLGTWLSLRVARCHPETCVECPDVAPQQPGHMKGR